LLTGERRAAPIPDLVGVTHPRAAVADAWSTALLAGAETPPHSHSIRVVLFFLSGGAFGAVE
jgi:hypothetical protein